MKCDFDQFYGHSYDEQVLQIPQVIAGYENSQFLVGYVYFCYILIYLKLNV